MLDFIDLDRYPLHAPDSAEWLSLVETCKAALAENGLFNLPGFLRDEALGAAVDELMPVLATKAFTHARQHNIYFRKTIEGLDAAHPALRLPHHKPRQHTAARQPRHPRTLRRRPRHCGTRCAHQHAARVRGAAAVAVAASQSWRMPPPVCAAPRLVPVPSLTLELRPRAVLPSLMAARWLAVLAMAPMIPHGGC